jgi:hypothetical protein
MMRKPTTMRIFNDFLHALPMIAAVMERGARSHQGEDWRAAPAGFHLARARRHLYLLAAGDVSEPHPEHRILQASRRRAPIIHSIRRHPNPSNYSPLRREK